MVRKNTMKNLYPVVDRAPRLQKRLLELVNSKVLATEIYDRIRATGSQRSQMHGLPKIHKLNVPLRPILSIIDSAQHELAFRRFGPCFSKTSKHRFKNSLTFAEFMKNLNIENKHLSCLLLTLAVFSQMSL